MIVVAILTAGGGILVALNTPQGESWAWLSSVAVAGYLLPPVLLGGLASTWDTTSSGGARRGLRRALLVNVGIQVLATAVMCVFTVLTGAPWWLTVVFTAVGIAAMATTVVLLPRLQRMERAHPATTSAPQYGRAEFRRDRRKILVTMTVTLVAMAVLIGVLAVIFPGDLMALFRYPPLFAAMAGAIACLLASGRIGRQIRDLVDGDMARANRIGKVVVRGKNDPLSEEDAVLVPAYASLSWVAQAYSVIGFLLLIGAVAAVQVFAFANDPSETWPIWFAAACGVALIVIVPVSMIQLQRTRAYATGARQVVG